MNDYVPELGDNVLVTVRATVDEDGDYSIRRSPYSGTTCIRRTLAAVVRVEPAPVELPTGFGARIRATVTCECSMRARQEAAVLVLAQPDMINAKWLAAKGMACGHRKFAEHEISDVVVLDGGEPS